MAKDCRPSVKDDKRYEGPRKKGMSKERAARAAIRSDVIGWRHGWPPFGPMMSA